MNRGTPTMLSLVLSLSLAPALAGNNFWESKSYLEWDEKEVEKLLRNSPWSKTIMLSTATPVMGGGMQEERGGTDPDAGGAATTGGRGSRGGGGLSQLPERPAPRITISWYSRPVREAMARSILLRNPEARQEQIDKILQYENKEYMEILVFGWSPRGRGRGSAQEVLQKLQQETFLQKKDKTRIPLVRYVLPTSPGQPVILQFARTIDGRPAVVAEDKEINLVAKLAETTIRTKFKLREMTVRGELQL